jgi:hypothetical protein
VRPIINGSSGGPCDVPRARPSALADTGNDLIVEHVIEFPAWRHKLSRLLAHLDVFLGERSRGDRRIGEVMSKKI